MFYDNIKISAVELARLLDCGGNVSSIYKDANGDYHISLASGHYFRNSKYAEYEGEVSERNFKEDRLNHDCPRRFLRSNRSRG